MGKFLNKKAQTPADNILLIVLLFAIAIGCVIAVYMYHAFTDQAKTMPEFQNNPNNASLQAMEKVNKATNNFDYAFLIIYIGGTIAMMILGYFIDVHSAFMVIYTIVLIIGVITCGIIGYVWDNFASTTQFYSLITTSFPITNHLLTNAGLYFLFSSALSFIVTFGKSRGYE